MPPITALTVQPAGHYTAMLGEATGRRWGGGIPTLAVWPKVALAALGRVDDHGAVPTAAVPPQPIGLVRAPVDPFLGIACASTERGRNTGR